MEEDFEEEKEIYVECLYKPLKMNPKNYHITFENSEVNIIIDTLDNDLIPLEPANEDKWSKGLLRLIVTEEKEKGFYAELKRRFLVRKKGVFCYSEE